MEPCEARTELNFQYRRDSNVETRLWVLNFSTLSINSPWKGIKDLRGPPMNFILFFLSLSQDISFSLLQCSNPCWHLTVLCNWRWNNWRNKVRKEIQGDSNTEKPDLKQYRSEKRRKENKRRGFYSL
jgi:hypothetical protein